MELDVLHELFSGPDSLEAILSGHEDDVDTKYNSDSSSSSMSTCFDEFFSAAISSNQIIDLDDKSCLLTKVTSRQDTLKTEIYPFHDTGPYIKLNVKTQKKKFFRCPFDTCNRMFFLEGFYKTHLISHRKNNFQCKYCSKVYRDQNQLQKHESAHCNKDGRWKLFQCSAVDCFQSFLSLLLLQKHEAQKHGLQFHRCSLCLKYFETKSLYLKHMRVHNSETYYNCLECGKSFKYSSSLNSHVKLHKSCESYACEQCGVEFNKSSNLNRHRMIHKGKNFFCKICFVNFSNKASLTKHVIKNHPNARKAQISIVKYEDNKC